MSPALPLSMRRQLLAQPRPRTGPFKSPSPRPGSFRRSLMPPLPPPGPFPSPSHPRSFPPPSAALGAPAVWHQSIGPRVQQYRAVPTERGACLSHHPHPPRAPPTPRDRQARVREGDGCQVRSWGWGRGAALPGGLWPGTGSSCPVPRAGAGKRLARNHASAQAQFPKPARRFAASFL